MATIYFGAYPPIYPHNGNWNDVNQWYSGSGNNSKKNPIAPVLLGRLPTNADDVFVIQPTISSGVGNWVGTYPAGSWVAGSFGGTVRFFAPFGTYPQVTQANTTWSGSSIDGIHLPNGGTVTGRIDYVAQLGNGSNISGASFFNDALLVLSGTVTLPASLTNVSILLKSGTFTTPLSYTSAFSGSPSRAIEFNTSAAVNIAGGIFNAPISCPTPVANDSNFNFTKYAISVTGGTVARSINTPDTGLRVFNINGGTFLQASDFVFGNPACEAIVRLNSSVYPLLYPNVFSTSKKITIYSRGNYQNIINFTGVLIGSLEYPVSSNTYSGVITVNNTTTLPSDYRTSYNVYSGTYAPKYNLPLLTRPDKSYYVDGSSLNSMGFANNTSGFTNYNPSITVTGVPTAQNEIVVAKLPSPQSLKHKQLVTDDDTVVEFIMKWMVENG